jgi:hypothetical protein
VQGETKAEYSINYTDGKGKAKLDEACAEQKAFSRQARKKRKHK